MSLVPFPKKAGSCSISLLLVPLLVPTLLAMSSSTLLPWPELRPRTFQVCYRKLWDVQSLVALCVTEGGYFPLFTQVVEETKVSVMKLGG